MQKLAVGFDVVDDQNAGAHYIALRLGGAPLDDDPPGVRGATGGAAAVRGLVRRRTVSMNGIICMGFDMYASQPASRTCISSARIAKAVTAMIGIWLIVLSSLIQRVRSFFDE